VERRDRLDRDVTHHQLVTGVDLAHVCEADPAQPRAGARGHDDRDVHPERTQGRHVEVVPVEVRDQHLVDVAQAVPRWHRLDPPERPDPCTEDRIRQQANAVEIDDDRRVTEELEAQRAGQRQPLRAASG
jgi:hypothetical protein